MKIGLTNLFSFRPHVEHLEFLARLLEQDGHEVVFFTCDSAVETCYIRELRGRSRIRECSQCIIGGVRSYRSQGVTPVAKAYSDLSDAEPSSSMSRLWIFYWHMFVYNQVLFNFFVN